MKTFFCSGNSLVFNIAKIFQKQNNLNFAMDKIEFFTSPIVFFDNIINFIHISHTLYTDYLQNSYIRTFVDKSRNIFDIYPTY